MKRIRNEPIAYDDHGMIPFAVPFLEIPPQEITFYLHLDTRVGKATCRQHCSHCFFRNHPQVRGRSVDLAEGRRIVQMLSDRGYRVFPVVADSFAGGGEFLKTFGNSHVREYRQTENRKHTRTMQCGEAWTSGAPLLGSDWRELLATAVASRFASVTLTFHGLLDEHLELCPQKEYPLRNVFPARDCIRVVRRVQRFNAMLAAGRLGLPAAGPLLQVNLGVTLGAHNASREHLLRYVRRFNRLGVSVVRFNRFHDHGGRHPDLTLSPDQVAAVYRDLNWIHQTIPMRFQLAVSEDLGTHGIDAMGFPPHVGQCRAGRQLFAIVPEVPVVLRENPHGKVYRVGVLTACVDAFLPVVGQLVCECDREGQYDAFDVEFFCDRIEDLQRKRLDGTYSDGCFAAELLAKRPSSPEDRYRALRV